jgi:hypothetical protein
MKVQMNIPAGWERHIAPPGYVNSGRNGLERQLLGLDVPFFCL